MTGFAQSSLFEEVAPRKATSHEIYIFYQVDGIDPKAGPKFTLADLVVDGDVSVSQRQGKNLAPDDQQDALTGRYSESSIWVRSGTGSDVDSTDGKQLRVTPNRISPDLHPQVRNLLSGERPDLASYWTLGTHAARFLKTADLYEANVDADQRRKKRMALSFSAWAHSRLTRFGIESEWLYVEIESAKLVTFATGHGFAVVRVTLARPDGEALSAVELLEALVAMSRFNKIGWRHLDDKTRADGETFTLGTLIRRLCHADSTDVAGRVSTYTFCQFEEPVSLQARDLFAAMAACRYTTDYDLAPDFGASGSIHDFVTVRHQIELEGAATIVGRTSSDVAPPPFLENFKASVFRNCYVPLALLALHEQAFLVNRTSGSAVCHADASASHDAIADLNALRGDALTFRLYYQFPRVSQISMHNSLYLLFRSRLGLDTMLAELTAKVSAIEEFLREIRDKKHEADAHARHARYYWGTIVAGSALAGLTTYTIVKEVGELIFHSKQIAGWSGVGVGAVSALVSGILGYLRRPPRKSHGLHDHEHVSVHTMIEHMIKRALKK